MSLGLGRSAFCLDRDVWLNRPPAVGLDLHRSLGFQTKMN